MDLLWIIGTIMVAQLTFAITGFASSKNPENHGIINLPMAYEHPECGRRASKFLGASQLIMLIITIILFFVLKSSITLIVICSVVAFVISFSIAILIIDRMVKNEELKG